MKLGPEEVNALGFIARYPDSVEAKTVSSSLKGEALSVANGLMGSFVEDKEINKTVQDLKSWAERQKQK